MAQYLLHLKTSSCNNKGPSPILHRSLVLTEKTGVDAGERGGMRGLSEVLYAKKGFAGMFDHSHIFICSFHHDGSLFGATVTHPRQPLGAINLTLMKLWFSIFHPPTVCFLMSWECSSATWFINVHICLHFIVLATMNPGGDFGKRELSPALRSRFTEIWVPQVVTNYSLIYPCISKWICCLLALTTPAAGYLRYLTPLTWRPC